MGLGRVYRLAVGDRSGRLGEVELHYAAYSSERLRELEDLAGRPWTEPLFDLTDPKVAEIAGIGAGGEGGADERLVSRGTAPDGGVVLPRTHGPLDPLRRLLN